MWQVIWIDRKYGLTKSLCFTFARACRFARFVNGDLDPADLPHITKRCS